MHMIDLKHENINILKKRYKKKHTIANLFFFFLELLFFFFAKKKSKKKKHLCIFYGISHEIRYLIMHPRPPGRHIGIDG